MTEEQLLQYCFMLEGMTLLQLAVLTGQTIPKLAIQRKGWAGCLIERFLGATAGTQALPDFLELGIELKTIPIGKLGIPLESTYISKISLQTVYKEHWETSSCYQKIKKILWVPIEGECTLSYQARRIGRAFLWSPNASQLMILQQDWYDITSMIIIGDIELLHAGIGQYLHVRPKAANSKSLCYASNAYGEKIHTLPRGFYLRRAFTKQLY